MKIFKTLTDHATEAKRKNLLTDDSAFEPYKIPYADFDLRVYN